MPKWNLGIWWFATMTSMAAVKITFLGTSSGTPTRTRNVTGQVLSFDNGVMWLLDCGEASQHQMMKAGLRAGRIERILITHLHGDHCYGLPGMLSCMAIHERRDPVEVVGPVGIREMIETILRLSVSDLPFPLRFTELSGDTTLMRMNGWDVSAHPIAHRIPCFGYNLRENPRPGRFDLVKAKALNIPEGPLFRQLQMGHAAQLPDGRIIAAQDVCDPPRPGRHVVLLGDTVDATGIQNAAMNCDVLVREVTYDAGHEVKANQWGHSTSTMTGNFASAIKARHVIITHFSSRYTDSDADGGVTQLIRETQACCPGTQVHAADDMWSFSVPFASGSPA
jgi:ribonuclease Z